MMAGSTEEVDVLLCIIPSIRSGEDVTSLSATIIEPASPTIVSLFQLFAAVKLLPSEKTVRPILPELFLARH
jgi:hypothetical protein